MLFNITEIVDILVMTFIIGFIFKDFLSARKVFHNPYEISNIHSPDMKSINRNVFWKDMAVAIAIAAPAIILHEMGHKFVAMSFGFQATFHAAYNWLIIALLLKLMNFGFIFLVPAYVSSSCLGGAFCQGNNFFLARSMISVAGPMVNLLLWLSAFLIIKKNLLPKKYKKYEPILMLSARINFFLMIFNMIPIPGFDGYHFFSSIFSFLF